MTLRWREPNHESGEEHLYQHGHSLWRNARAKTDTPRGAGPMAQCRRRGKTRILFSFAAPAILIVTPEKVS
jgi:hypothetical protein